MVKEERYDRRQVYETGYPSSRQFGETPRQLGLLEKQAKKVLLAWGQFHKDLRPKHLIFAADNGVVHSGVVAQLADITYMQSRHMVEAHRP